ncbi:Hypothetical protein D9617_25g062100 [Elsinoe fawcettii]|nr:Hypothetical protein D9617_25g062100 [Elsinoe fawcettii]
MSIAPDAYTRRREQIRKAQRTHCERKAIYVQELEETVADLRRRHAADQRELTEQKVVVRRLEDLLHKHSVHIPIDLYEVTSGHDNAHFELLDQEGSDQILDVHVSQAPSSGRTDSEFRDTAKVVRSNDQNTTTGFRQLPDASDFSYGHPNGLDGTQIAVNFVLALERPCLYHHKFPSPELQELGLEGTGHENMLMSPIMQRAPEIEGGPTAYPQMPAYHSGRPWTVAATELEYLLQLSHQLDRDDQEVTPIQAWQVIKSHANFATMDSPRLASIQSMLPQRVICEG